ncbi:MAG: MarR family transcriptional regulator [Bacillota bacterium]|nr:MarR family transcriptional regulator [Bacillota bacterium]
MNECNDMLNLIFEFSKATRSCQREWNCEGLTVMQFYILNLIAVRGAMELSSIHEALSVEKSTTTRLIEPLIKRNLIIKEKCCADSRIVTVRLTEKGEEIHERGWNCLESYTDAVTSTIPEEKRKDVIDNVRLFLKAIGETCC